jgi:predicted RNase H-like HicB family nuclease
MTEYRVIYEMAEDGGWGAHSPDVPGCCVACGESRAEVERLMREAVPFHLEGLREAGTPVPDSYRLVELVAT